MDGCNRFGKKITLDDRWMAQAVPLGKNEDGSLLLSINEITHYFQKWTTGSGVLKKLYFLYKNVMLQIDPLESSCSQRKQYPEGAFKVKSRTALWRKWLLRKSQFQVQLFTTALLKYLL